MRSMVERLAQVLLTELMSAVPGRNCAETKGGEYPLEPLPHCVGPLP
jgi:hypothetical protein